AEEVAPHVAIVEKQGLYWKSPLPPGRTQLRFGFVLPVESADLAFSQMMPLAMDGVRMIVERTDKMSIDGATARQREERDHQGRKFFLVGSNEMQPPQVPIQLGLHGLPVESRRGAWAALGTSLAIALWGFVAARRPTRAASGAAAERKKLEARRERLLMELVLFEEARRAGRMEEARSAERREQLVAALERIYRELDSH